MLNSSGLRISRFAHTVSNRPPYLLTDLFNYRVFSLIKTVNYNMLIKSIEDLIDGWTCGHNNFRLTALL